MQAAPLQGNGGEGMYVLRLAADLAKSLRLQWADRRHIAALQTRALQSVIAHSYATVPLYRERFDRAGIRPGDVRGLADLAHLPVLTRGELEAADLKQRVSSLFDPAKLKVARTSGASGRPLTFHNDPYSRRLRKAQFLRALVTGGYRPGDSVLMLTRGPRAGNPFWLRWRHAGRDTPPEQHLAVWREMRPRFAYGMVTPLRRLALLVRDEPQPRHRVRAVFTTGETLDGVTRNVLEEAFGGPVFDIYGSCELGTAAWECEHHDGLHIAEDVILTELLPLPGSDVSRLVITSLKNRAVPLIRYEIGDLAATAPAERCACGRSFRRMARLQGRLIDCLHRPDGALVAPYPVEAAIENVRGVARFQVVQDRVDAVHVRVQGAAGAAVADGVRAALAPLLGPAMQVEVSFTADLEPPPGQKFRLVDCRLARPPASH